MRAADEPLLTRPLPAARRASRLLAGALLAAATSARCAPAPRATAADTARPRATAGGEPAPPNGASATATPTRVPSATRASRSLAPLGVTTATGALARADLGDLSAILAAAPEDGDPAVTAARRALLAGTAWRATRAITPALRDRARATPTVRLLAAAAAAGWGGWSEVERIIAPDPASLAHGHGWALLARAALARDTGPSPRAVDAARQAVASAPNPRERGVRLVLLGTALDRIADADGARAAWQDAALDLPQLGDWLLLHAATASPERAARERIYADLASPASRAWVARVEATARERAGDADAPAAWLAAGEPTRALALRLAAVRAGTAPPATADSVRRALLAIVASRAGESRRATALLDSAFAPLRADEQLATARAATVTGPATRAAAGYATAGRGGLALSDEDRFAHASALAALGRHREAAERFATVGGRLAGRAGYQRARSLLRAGRGDAAVAALHTVVERHAGDTTAAASALWLLADLATDAGRTSEARVRFRRLADAYPTTPLAADAALKAGLLAYTAGANATAARELEALSRTDSASDAGRAAAYWSGRAWWADGDRERARAAWRATAARIPGSYYGMLAARRLGRTDVELLDATATSPSSGAPRASQPVMAALERAAVLDQLGLDDEAGLEREWAIAAADSSTTATLAVAAELQRQGLVSRGIRLAQRALDAAGAPTPDAFRLVYPLPAVAPVAAEARARGVDPSLAAALIWQESRFTPTATSPAGARGLMQVMPAVGRQLAEGAGYPAWDPALLWQPDVSIELGMRHLASGLRRWPHPAYALAAYNAGDSRVVRWRRSPGSDDPELFVERIPYAETRDYVRIILRNRAWYSALWPSASR